MWWKRSSSAWSGKFGSLTCEPLARGYFASERPRLSAAADARSELIELAFEIREQDVRAGAAHQISIEGRRAAGAHGRQRLGRVLKLSQAGLNVLQAAAGATTVAPQSRHGKHQSKDQTALTAERQSKR